MTSIKIRGGADIRGLNEFDDWISLSIRVPLGKRTIVLECESVDTSLCRSHPEDFVSPDSAIAIPNVAKHAWEGDSLTFGDASADPDECTMEMILGSLTFSCESGCTGKLTCVDIMRPQAALLWPIFKRYAETGEFGPPKE